MKINRSLVKQLRLQKALSQEELALAAGMSARTVQRMEAEGLASLESRKAVAAVFGVHAERLLERVHSPNLGDLMKVFASSALLVAATFFLTCFGIHELLVPMFPSADSNIQLFWQAWGVAGAVFLVLAARELRLVNSQRVQRPT